MKTFESRPKSGLQESSRLKQILLAPFFLVAVSLLFSPNGLGTSVQASSLRDQFEAAKLTIPPDIIGTAWTCETLTLFNNQLSFHKYLFQFGKVLHNDYMAYSRTSGKLPQWFPAWFSWIQTMHATVYFKTRDYMQPMDCEDFMSCLDGGVERENKAYLRMASRDQLLIEWTSRQPAENLPPSHSVKDEPAFAYSTCFQEPYIPTHK